MKYTQKGFSLVEIMVAMVIGMISMVVVMQVFFLSEGRKRTTTGGADAQTNGAIGFYMLGRDIKMAGWGIDSSAYGTCNTVYSYCNGNASCGGVVGPIANFGFASIRITDGGTRSDSITAQYFANPNLDTYRYPATAITSSTMPLSSSPITVSSTSGCANGDMVLLSNAGNCTLAQASDVQSATLRIAHDEGGTNYYNPSAAYQLGAAWPAYPRGAAVSCFKKPAVGPIYQRMYSLSNANQLQRSDNTVTPVVTNEVVATDIVEMQAQYGIAPVASQSATTWVSAAAAPWITPTPTDWKRIKAVRVVIVARSGHIEKPNASGVCATTTDAMVAQWSNWHTFNTSTYPANWRCYRYKAFESVIPLRNVIWANL